MGNRTDTGEIFRRGSRTFFFSSIFFPADKRRDITVLYSFVRTVDDYIDSVPPDIRSYRSFRKQYASAAAGRKTDNAIISGFLDLSRRYRFDPSWTEGFFRSMEQDIKPSPFRRITDTVRYMYGSAAVIGLYISAILGLSDESRLYAMKLGECFQFINFIRDIDEDTKLGRQYFPVADLAKYNLASLSFEDALANPKGFYDFVQFQIRRYGEWQQEAEKGYRHIPRRYLVPIKTAADMFRWTAEVIRRDPFIVYRNKVKPSAFRIIVTGLFNFITA